MSDSMREPIELTLGGQAYKIEPLTVDQVCALEALFLSDIKLTPLQQAREAVRIALSDGRPELEVAKMRGVAAIELAGSLPRILRFAGFEAAKSGEAAAAA